MPAGLRNIAAIAGGARHSLALAGHGPPVLTAPLVDRTIAFGGNAFFRAAAVGLGPLQYQWKFKGDDLPGATNTVLALTNVQYSQAGTYSVVVNNPLGQSASETMEFGVTPLLLTKQPRDQSTCLAAVFPSAWRHWAKAQFPTSGDLMKRTCGSNEQHIGINQPAMGTSGGVYAVVSNALAVLRSIDARLSLGSVAAWEITATGRPTCLQG
jgi:hypothetical protein